ncbi:unnamed protein product [Jaminaea pallidilutea]
MGGAVHYGLASLLDDIMDIRDCDVYTFHPDMESDPHACLEPEGEADDAFFIYDTGASRSPELDNKGSACTIILCGCGSSQRQPSHQQARQWNKQPFGALAPA